MHDALDISKWNKSAEIEVTEAITVEAQLEGENTAWKVKQRERAQETGN